MTLIKIKRSSIKKNPNAGRTSLQIPGNTTVSGTFKGKIPRFIKDKVIVTSEHHPVNDEPEYEWVLIDAPDNNIIEKIAKTKGASVNIENEIIETTWVTPEPDYLFEYHNPTIECSSCHEDVRLNDIEDGYIFDSDGEEHNADKCPKCGELNSFDYEYEKISDILK